MNRATEYPINVIGLGCADLTRQESWLPYRSLLEDSDVICGGKGQLSAMLAALPELAATFSLAPLSAPDIKPENEQGDPASFKTSSSGLLLSIGAEFGRLPERLRQLRAQGRKIAVLASGDPLFYGVGASLAVYFKPEELLIRPAVSSMQEACARLALPWHETRMVSLHGRDGNLPVLYRAVHGALLPKPVCVLLDHKHSPAQLAELLLERGVTGYRMHFFSGLRSLQLRAGSGPDQAAVKKNAPQSSAGPAVGAAFYASAPLVEAARAIPSDAPAPGLIILEPFGQTPPVKTALPSPVKSFPSPLETPTHRLCLGMPDDAFTHSAGLITKQPVRAAVIAALRLLPEHTLFDLGAGCGSVGLEASVLLHGGRVFAVEQHAERVAHIIENRKKFRAANLEIVHGDALASLEDLPEADRIFIGGGLGTAQTIGNESSPGAKDENALPADQKAGAGETSSSALLRAAWGKLKPGGRLTLSCVLLGSLDAARRFFARQGVSPELLSIQAAAASPLAGDLQLKAMNQVFVMSAWKPENE